MNCTNKFLVSLPILQDFSFKRSLVYVDEHTGNGAHGYIINKIIDEKISQNLRKGMGLDLQVPIYYGGPLDLNNVSIIHTSDVLIPTSDKLTDNLWITQDKSILQKLNSGLIPEKWKLIVGHSSWGAGQLESEVLGSRTGGISSWAITNYDSSLFWEEKDMTKWNTGLKRAVEEKTNELLGC